MAINDMVYHSEYRRMRESGTVIQDIDGGIARYLTYFGTEFYKLSMVGISRKQKNLGICI